MSITSCRQWPRIPASGSTCGPRRVGSSASLPIRHRTRSAIPALAQATRVLPASRTGEMSDTPPGLDVMKDAWSMPVSGDFRMPRWHVSDESGGCCSMSHAMAHQPGRRRRAPSPQTAAAGDRPAVESGDVACGMPSVLLSGRQCRHLLAAPVMVQDGAPSQPDARADGHVVVLQAARLQG